MSPASPEDEGALGDIRTDDQNAILHLFLEYGRSKLSIFGIGGIASVLSRTIEIVPAYLLAVAIDSLFFDERSFDLWGIPNNWLPTDPRHRLLLVIGLLATAYLLEAGLSWVNDWCWNNFAQHFQHEVRIDTYDAMQRRAMSFFDDKQTGEVMSVLNNDVTQLESFLISSFNNGIRIVVRVGGMGAVMLLINWRLGIIPTLVIPLLAFASYLFVSIIHPKYQNVRSAVGQLNSRLENNIGGLAVVKVYNREDYETDRVESAFREYLDANWDAITTRIKFFPSIQLITAAGYVATFLIGGWWIGLVGVADETDHVFSGQFVGILLTEFLDSLRSKQQREEIHRYRFVGDRHGVTVTDSVSEQFGVALDRIPIDLDAVVGVENPLDAVERILRGMVETEIDDRFAVETVLVEQFGHVGVDRFLTLLASVPLDGDRHVLEAVLSDENGEAP